MTNTWSFVGSRLTANFGRRRNSKKARHLPGLFH
jgi:hypothetical protein